MPRLPRLDAPGLLNHVMARGIERRDIFKDDKDRKTFLKRLGDILEETQTQCYADAKTNPEDPVDRACPVGAKHRTGVKNNKISGRGKSVYLFPLKAVFSRR